MSKKRRMTTASCAPDSFVSCLRKFLTPAVYKHAHQACPAQRASARWTVQPILLVLLTMTWCSGDSQGERFETARAFCIALTPKRRRPGQSVNGFQQALSRLPAAVLRAVAAALRQQLLLRFGRYLDVEGFIPLGVDGSRLRCPRTAQLQQRLGQAAQAEAPPQIWVTALVHLRLGLLWAWRLGRGDASERQHLQQLLPTLPDNALVVADAGYQGYDVTAALMQAGVCFLIRVSSQTTLYSLEEVPATAWSDGWVYWWTTEAQKRKLPPLLLRLLRVRDTGRRHDVWLLTNVPSERLSPALAGRFYKMRWENEGFFRTYKRTLNKVKLSARTVRLVHREAEGSLLAVQVLLAQGAWALVVMGQQPGAVSSPRGVLREIRREIEARLGERQRRRFLQRLAQAQRERRLRRSSKVKQAWPSRANHKPPQPPKVRKMSDKLKALVNKNLMAA